jgi:hypothetical protein
MLCGAEEETLGRGVWQRQGDRHRGSRLEPDVDDKCTYTMMRMIRAANRFVLDICTQSCSPSETKTIARGLVYKI